MKSLKRSYPLKYNCGSFDDHRLPGEYNLQVCEHHELFNLSRQVLIALKVEHRFFTPSNLTFNSLTQVLDSTSSSFISCLHSPSCCESTSTPLQFLVSSQSKPSHPEKISLSITHPQPRLSNSFGVRISSWSVATVYASFLLPVFFQCMRTAGAGTTQLRLRYINRLSLIRTLKRFTVDYHAPARRILETIVP